MELSRNTVDAVPTDNGRRGTGTGTDATRCPLWQGREGTEIPVGNDGKPCRYVMSMGNLLRVPALESTEMATTEATVGIDHVTVVPENFEPTDGPRPRPESDDADQ
jgi:hypothetical protein